MQAISETKAAVEESAADAAAGWDNANRQALHFMIGAQRMIFEEMAFTADAMLDRLRTETHLLGEFAAKLAASHSLQDWKAMGSECGQHQLEFVRREYGRLFRHNEWLIEATSNLMDNRY
jgi:hypothetical protein